MAFAQFPVTDTFSTAGPTNLNATNWTQITSGTRVTAVVQQNAGVLSSTGGSGFDPIAISLYTSQTFGNDQIAMWVVGPDSTFDSNSSPIIRGQAGTGNGYEWDFTANKLRTQIGGTLTDLTMTTNCPSVNTNDVIAVAAIGTTIYCLDVTTGQRGTATDSTFTSGSPGVQIGTFAGALKASGPFKADCFPYSCNSVSASPDYTPFLTAPPILDYYSASPITVTLTANAGWTKCYTIDGTTPTATTPGTCTHGTTYSSPFVISTTGVTTVKTMATKSGSTNSTENDYSYNVGVSVPVLNGVQMFPSNSIFNTRVDSLPVDSVVNPSFQTTYGTSTITHNWGQGPVVGGFGIPWNAAISTTPQYTITSWTFGESDNGPYYILDATNIENVPATGCTNTNLLDPSHVDYHNLTVVNLGGGAGQLQEMYQASCTAGTPNGWVGASGAIWDLTSNNLRTAGFTSADAAGLPMTPFLIKYDEAITGVINHPSRFTLHSVNSSTYVWPGRHAAGSGGLTLGLRVRLKASFDISGFSPMNQVILTSWKQYGMFLADTGNTGYIQGSSDPRWNETDLDALQTVTLGNFEVIDESACQVSADSGQSSCTASTVAGGSVSGGVKMSGSVKIQ